LGFINLDCAIGMNFLRSCTEIIKCKRMHFQTEENNVPNTRWYCQIVCLSVSQSISQSVSFRRV